jgi:hypothetical protein
MLLGSVLPELSALLHTRLKEVPRGTSGVFVADDARKSFCKGAPERWKELSSAVAADPAALLAFLKLPESESILTELLYLVETEFKVSPSVTAQIDATVAEFLASGSPRQKLSTLGWLMRESSKGAVVTTIQSKPPGELYLELLSGTDPEVARDALYGLAQYCGDAFVSNFDRVKEASDRSRDTGFKTDCLYGLAYQKGPRAEALYLEQTAEALQGSIEEVRAVAVTLLDQTLSNRLTSIDETSYFAMLSRVIDAGAAPSIYPNLLEVCFRLPRGQCVTLLEQARQKAPTPELLGVTNGVLEMVNRGETRREVLRRALSP